MTDRQSAAPDRLHSLPRYRQPLPRENATRHIVVLQSAAACSAFWRIHGEARNAGLEDDEIDITHTLAGHRLVYCAHCGLTQAGGPEPLLSCIGCAVGLEVREHFSKRLGAYLGVCTNPDQPYSGARS